MRRGLCFLLCAAALLAIAPVGATTREPCSYGDARQYFETFPLKFEGTPPPCTYRLFFTGRQFSFTEDDYFLGGVVLRIPYRDNAGRLQAIGQLKAASFRVWLAAVTPQGTGAFAEQVVERTELKTANYEPLGEHVWSQWGIVRRLPPGEYLSVTQASFTPEPWIVRLLITPTS